MITLLPSTGKARNIHADVLAQVGMTPKDFRDVEFFKVNNPGLNGMEPGIYKVRHVDSFHVYTLLILELPEEPKEESSDLDVENLFKGDEDEDLSRLQGSDTGDQEGPSGDGDKSTPQHMARQNRKR